MIKNIEVLIISDTTRNEIRDLFSAERVLNADTVTDVLDGYLIVECRILERRKLNFV